MTTAADVLRLARGEIGFNETPVNRTKFGVWYGMDGQPWCSIFVSWCLSNAGLHYQIAYCPAGVAYWREKGLLDRTPQPGDVAFYWHANLGRYGHTGLVEAVNPDGTFVAIEGNTNAGGSRTGGGVRRLRRKMAPKTVFGHPPYDGRPAAGPGPKPVTNTSLEHRPLIKAGARGDLVRLLQTQLSALGFDTHGVDGDFGPNTTAAVNAFQQAKGLDVDGQVGPATWAALGPMPAPSTPGGQRPLTKAGARGDHVRTLQTRLTELGFDTHGVDGDFGPNTTEAVQAFQRSKGLDVDGEVGPATWAALG